MKLDLPPGLFRMGTAYQSAGRWYQSHLVRWIVENSRPYIRPIGGWEEMLDAAEVAGSPRCAHAWLDNNDTAWLAIGTTAGLWVTDGTTLEDISPDGWTDTSDASTWTLDNFGELLIACNDEDERVLEWQPGGGSPATAVSNAPAARAIVVTEEKFIVAFGTDGDPRNYAWCDQENRTQWTASATNQAGDLPTHSIGRLMSGQKIRGGFLIHTTEGLFLARYIGFPDIYGHEEAAARCGIVGRNAKAAAADGAIYWMGRDRFWRWLGYAEEVPCEISDEVFGNLNTTHRHKAWALDQPKSGELWFFYPSGSATECSHFAVYSYRGGFWNHGQLSRGCGAPEGVFSHPVMVSDLGQLWFHEKGWAYPGNDGTETLELMDDEEAHVLTTDEGDPLVEGGVHVRSLRSGPVEIGDGERRLQIDDLIPDEGNQGDCEATFYFREYPNAAETEFGPFSSSDRVGVFATARQAAIQLTAGADVGDFKVGTYRVNVRARGRY